MSRDITRREMAVALVASAPALAQVAADPEEKARKDPFEAAREQVRRSVKKLDDYDLPMATEPAFVFKP